MEVISLPVSAWLSSRWRYIIYTTHLTTNWFGMWATRLTDTKFSQDGVAILSRIENIKALAVSPKGVKASTTRSASAILLLLFLLPWEWLWQQNIKTRMIGRLWPLSA